MRQSSAALMLGLLMGLATPVQALDAVVDWAHKVELGIPVSGVIAEVHVGTGQHVKKGDALIQLEPAPFAAAVQQAEAALARARLQYRKARRDDDQAKELYERQVLSTTQLEDAAMALQEAGAAVKDAKGRLQSAQYELNKSVLGAPFDAVVLTVKAIVGQTVVSRLQAQSLVTLASRTLYVARAEVPSDSVVAVGQPAWVIVEAVPVKGQVRAIAPVSGGLQIEVTFELQRSLQPGTKVELKLEQNGT